MTAKDLFEAIGLVDEDLIEEAAAPAPGKKVRLPAWRRVLPLAACLCVAAGAALAWRAGPWGGVTAGEAAPQLAAATAPEEGVTGQPAPELYADGDIANGGNAAGPEAGDSAGQESRAAGGIPEELAQAITPAAGGNGPGDGPMLAAAPEELVDAPSGSASLPESMAVYRSALADGGIDEDGMRQTMARLLEALGFDPDLAGSASLVYNYSSDQVESADSIADSLMQQFGSGSAMTFWAGIAQLELELPGGGSMTVRNSRRAVVSLAEDSELHPIGSGDLDANSGLLDALGGFSLARWQGAGRSWQDGSLLPGQLSLYRPGAPGGMTGVLVDDAGALAAFDLSGAVWAEQVGSFPVIDQSQAETLLYSGTFLNAGFAERDPADGAIADARLCYLDGDAQYYVPMWQFLVDFGTPDSELYPTADPDTGAALHDYRFYYVPAVDLDTLAAAVAEH